MRSDGTPVVIQGDRVACPCGKNRVLAGADARCFYHTDTGSQSASLADTQSGSNAAESFGLPVHHDEKFSLRDAHGNVLADTFYTIRLSSGQMLHGITDQSGNTSRYPTDGSQRIAIYLGHRESAT
jgi:hypothetical protein